MILKQNYRIQFKMSVEKNEEIGKYSRVHNSLPFGLFMKQNAYVPVGGNEGGGRATPTSISIFDSYDRETL